MRRRAPGKTCFPLWIWLFFVLSLLSMLPGTNAWAGGSISREDFLRPLRRDPVLRKLLTESLDFAETGWAIRLPSGERIPPYDILAKPKGSQNFRFVLELNVDPLTVSIREATAAELGGKQ